MNYMVERKNVRQPPTYSAGNDNEITVAIASLSLGGAERIVLDWATRVYPLWRVHIIVLRDRKQEWPVPHFVRVTRLHGRQFVQQLRAIGAELARSSNPVCVCHLLSGEERDALAQSGVRVVTTMHNAKAGWSEGITSLARSSSIIAVSAACANDLRESGWNGPISIIRHIPPRRQFVSGVREAYRRAWRIPLNAVVIGMIGAVKPQKNYLRALQILKTLHERIDAYLVIIGGPVNTLRGKPAWQEMVDEIERLGLRRRVALPGFVPDAADCLPAFDVMLNSSLYEGLSIATLEELIAGLPVVASRVGGQGEISSSGLTLMPESADDAQWADALETAIHSAPAIPDWADFPSYRLWTLLGLAKPLARNDTVLFVTANLNSGGAQRSLVNLVKELKGKINFSIAVTGMSTSDHFSLDLQRSGIAVHCLGARWDAFDFAELLTHKISRGGYGTVCFWNADARIKLLLVKGLECHPLRFIDVSPGDYLYEEMETFTSFQQLVAFDQSGYFSRIDGLVLKYSGPYPPECAGRVRVIPNGVPAPKRIKSDYFRGECPRIVVSGRIAPTKYLKEIIMSVERVWMKFPLAELHVYGGAEHYHAKYAQEVHALAETEMGKRIFFHGVNFNVVEKLPDYDVFVVLGKHQGCPNALLEALSVGLPSIANNDGGTREQIIDGKTGLLLNGCDPEELAVAIMRILGDPTLARRIGTNGRKHIARGFSMERMVNAYIDLLGCQTIEHAKQGGFFARLQEYIRQIGWWQTDRELITGPDRC